MRNALIVTTSLVLVSVVICGLASDKAADLKPPVSVLIVKEGLHSREGVAKTTAVSVVNPKTIEVLESLFPNYRKFPSSSIAAGWEAGYRVYFTFPKGRTVCVTVSWDAKTWSTGDGDFSTQGDFEKLVKQIEAEAP